MKRFILAISCAMSVLLIVSCGSTPEAEPQPEVKDAVEEVKEEVKEDVKEETPAPDFSAANQTLLALTQTARENAIAANAKSYYPEGFDVAETRYTEIKNNVSANSSADYSRQIKDLTARYQSLAAASQAQALKAKADELSLAGENQSAYDAGAKALEEYAGLGADASGEDLLAKANEALNSYNDVVNKGLRANAARERNAALEAKKNADSVKAGVARKDEYTKASETFKKADSSYVTADIEGAYNGYKSAKETFTSLYEDIKDRRAAAQALIDAAKQKVADTESYATEADSIAPIEGEVAGIEAEDAVLLEDDNFANPDDAVIDVESDVTAKTAEKVAQTAIAVEEAANAGAESASEAVDDAAENIVNSVSGESDVSSEAE